MKFSILAFLLLFFNYAFSQDCDCPAQLSFVVHYYEENNPAFQKLRSNPAAYSSYLHQLQGIKTEASLNRDEDSCIIYLDRYVKLLKDHHSGIGFNLKRRDLSTPELIADFKNSADYRRYKKMAIDTGRLIPVLASKKLSDIEGIYTNGATISFGIVQQDKLPGRYVGIVLKSNKLLDVGHVLLELTRKADNTYDVVYNIGLLGFNFRKVLKNQDIKNGQITSFGFYKLMNAGSDKAYEFKELDPSTNYLRLSSFEGSMTEELDSFYATIDQRIKSKPYLIVDIRSNGGGSERSYLNLLPYAYTRPLKLDAADVWVSPENIKRYEENPSEDNAALIKRMKAAKPFTFIPQTESPATTWSLDSPTVFPKRIAVLFNGGTASAAEGMLLYFMQSDKVITIGENSGGYVGYGNVMTAQTPCGNYTVQSTTTKYFTKSKYEFTGIAPMYRASKQKDWTGYAKDLLARK